jgi:hypothetical protein
MGRYCCVLALLLVCSGCSSFLPGLPGLSFAGTDADCAAQGSQQPDPASKPCADATQQAAKPPAKPRARTATTATEFQSHGVAVEPDAKIDGKLKGEVKLVSGLVGLVRARGYQCDTVSSIEAYNTDNGFRLACNHSGYRYEIENRSGDWAVAIK